MPKPRRGKLLGGSSSHEDQIIGNLIASLIEFEKIERDHILVGDW